MSLVAVVNQLESQFRLSCKNVIIQVLGAESQASLMAKASGSEGQFLEEAVQSYFLPDHSESVASKTKTRS